jgi:hypothetical protein
VEHGMRGEGEPFAVAVGEAGEVQIVRPHLWVYFGLKYGGRGSTWAD